VLLIAITARVEAISHSGPAFWLELKKTVRGAFHGPYYKKGKSTGKSLVINIAIHATPLKTIKLFTV